ncbi:MAG: mraZ [Opitutaceae bacterium]|nr:mraZ [Opitutaceae bacterium]
MPTSGKVFFTGSFPRTLDDKGRLTIPSEWRSAHANDEQFMIAPMGGYLAVLPPAELDRLHAKISAMDLSDSDAQESASTLFSAVQSFGWDTVGRVVLKPELLEHAGIAKDVVFVGALTKFNIYSAERWAQVKSRAAGANFGDLMRRLRI